MQIGTVAKNTGLTPDAIRFYERQGLVARPLRSEGGFRLYGEAEVADLVFVQKAQRLGFSLNEIRELMALRKAGDHACSQVRARLQRKLAVVRDKIKELGNLQEELCSSLELCKRQLRRKTKPTGPCPVLEDGCSKGRE